MHIAMIAHDKKKELMVQFCMAYKSIFSKHHLCATRTTGSMIAEATGLPVEKLLAGNQGGVQQITARITYDEIDLVLCFRDPVTARRYEPDVSNLMSLCDIHAVPIATNSATAEVLIQGLERGDLDWRNILNPKNRD